MNRMTMWKIGQIISVIVGLNIWYEYSFPAALAVYFIVQLLIDIRYEVTRDAD